MRLLGRCSGAVLDLVRDELARSFQAVPAALAALRLLAAMLLGGVVGLERELHSKPAGLRTHMLVSLAACLFIVAGQELTRLSFGEGEVLRVDPLRLIEAVTAGVAFLAAGFIFTSQGEVRNLTTGVSLWLAGAIGVACGAGQIPLALLAATLTVLVLWLLGKLEARFLS
jgi:putative Mg2+ transporter-C (MgtC) family protein